ncbi:hypothetical protein [uncultured Cetobacterium sp.]|uniref:hypothetical protein n=1 Tax=uncultured Cetobacterium sp. TaxID=527638 RepID=UPI00260457E6|nr:hypothetical protein [uncultured Cetobacterium sp.]
MKNIKNNLKMSNLLLKSFNLLKQIQKEIYKDFINFKFIEDIEFKFKNENFKESLQKNFFTLLMLSTFVEAGIKKERAISYGKIIIYLRQIVTSTDNVIDNEKKGLIYIKKLQNDIVKNSFITLFCQDALTKEALKISDSDNLVSIKILEKIYSIAISESLRDVSQYEIYPDAEYILKKIHAGIGGELLEISLEIPKYLEKNIKMTNYAKGLYKIGMGLQALDDFFDMDEDREQGKVNLLTSKIKYEENSIEEIKSAYLNEVMENTYKGFKVLEENGFPISKVGTKKIMKKLFELRGLKDYIFIIK